MAEKEKSEYDHGGGRPRGPSESKEVTQAYTCKYCRYSISYTGQKRVVRSALIRAANIHFKTCPNNPMRPR